MNGDHRRSISGTPRAFCGLIPEMPRLPLAAVWLFAVAMAVSVGGMLFGWSRGPHAKTVPIEQIPKSRHDANPWARWTVTEQLSAHHVLIVHVETNYLKEARAIARTIVDPILPKDNYAEILVYFERPGRPDPLPPRRVQWTPRAGFVETVYDAAKN
jgi:hypothetical protein